MDKPLHVQVAEALGWRIENYMTTDPKPTGAGIPPGGRIVQDIPRFDTDWSATGPLIERYQIQMEPPEMTGGWEWRAGNRAYGPTPLIAVCNLILALKAAGKLGVSASTDPADTVIDMSKPPTGPFIRL